MPVAGNMRIGGGAAKGLEGSRGGLVVVLAGCASLEGLLVSLLKQ